MDLGQGLVLALSEWFLVPGWEGAAHATRAEPAARGHAGGGATEPRCPLSGSDPAADRAGSTLLPLFLG